MNKSNLKEYLDRKVDEHNQPSFIKDDPICIPHLFSLRPDIEIAGFFAAIFAWGNRTTIIQKSRQLMELFHLAPYDFVLHHSDKDLKSLLSFKHRTFNATDLLYFVEFLRFHYRQHDSLEVAFTLHGKSIENMLTGFHRYFFSLEDAPARTKKHISTPGKNSSCKRLNMFLRWMVRNDDRGVDFGLWRNISPSQLICPIDLHVARVAKRMKLLDRTNADWKAALDLTARLREFDNDDPVKYDFALFSLGAMERF
jgi:uncharacterized protein (TIGR02757 family)